MRDTCRVFLKQSDCFVYFRRFSHQQVEQSCEETLDSAYTPPYSGSVVHGWKQCKPPERNQCGLRDCHDDRYPQVHQNSTLKCEFHGRSNQASHASHFVILGYGIRIAFVTMEFGSRKCKNFKKVVSLVLGCLLLYRLGLNLMGSNTSIKPGSSYDLDSNGSMLVVFFLTLKLVLKTFTLLDLFKKRKNLRLIKLLKLLKFVLKKYVMNLRCMTLIIICLQTCEVARLWSQKNIIISLLKIAANAEIDEGKLCLTT